MNRNSSESVESQPELPARRMRRADSPAPIEQLDAGALIADVATALAQARPDDVDAEIDRALHLVGVWLGLESLTVAVSEKNLLRSASDWRATGWMDPPVEIDLRRADWLRSRLEKGEEITVALLPRLPDEASYERQLFADRGVAAFAVLPIVWGQALSCLIAEAGIAARTWSSLEMRVLEALASAVAAAYERRAYHLTLIEQAEAARAEVVRANRFLALFAHELRSPLTAIIGYTEMLAGGMAGPLGPNQTAYIQDILDSGNALGALIASGLDLARIDEGQMSLRFSELDVVSLIDSALTQMAPRARDGQLSLQAELPVDSLPVRGDPQRLLQVLVNLVGNAVKFTPAGGQVLVRLRPGEIDYQIEVIDTGVGILARDLERIFEKFARLSAPTNGRKSGESVGLGLPLVKRLVEMHGGAVAVESTPGQGSTFRITLPRTPPPPPVGRSPYVR